MGMRYAAATVTVCACLAGACSSGSAHAFTAAGPGRATSPPSGQRPSAHQGQRPLPRTLYGVTANDVSDPRLLATAARHLPETPITRLYLDIQQPPGYYAAAVAALRPVSYLMGELLDSSDETRISVAAYDRRVRSYVAAFGGKIDIWEIGNEVNGNWTGPYPAVRAKLTVAYRDVSAQGRRAALTLYYNRGCGDGPAELGPVAFTRNFVPRKVRNGLAYVFLSYYQGGCQGARPSARTWTAYFRALHALYPHARLGFGEIGLGSPATRKTISTAKSMIGYYYGLRIHLPYYAGGYFWWYYYEDCLPYATKPLWQALRRGIQAEAASQLWLNRWPQPRLGGHRIATPRHYSSKRPPRYLARKRSAAA